ncbi:MAG: hypothetical protein K8S16_01930, partial [Bacteroidales bacterium]|nr:hypothetical protein [Bacteroidales bacterium]
KFGSYGGTVEGGGTIIPTGTSTGVLTLTGYNGSINKWQKQLNGGGWTDIPATVGLITYSEIPTSTGIWEYRAEVQNGTCPVDYSLPAIVTVLDLDLSQWTGAISDDWFNVGNWSSGIPIPTRDAIIPAVAPQPYPVLNGVADCYAINIAPGASLTIQADGALTAYSDFINNGQFIIESTAGGDGSFIDNGTITGLGSFNIGRYLISQRWHYISPPVSHAVSGIFLDIYLTEWDEPSGLFTYILPIDVDLNMMEGYGTWADNSLTGTTTVFYEGPLNTGTITSEVLTNTSAAAHQSKGFNFVGNPYPSAIDWDEGSGWTKTNLDNAVYIWNPSFGQYGSYVNGTSVNDVTNIIPSGQGFYIHVSTGSPTGLLQVNNSARLHSNDPFFKNSGKGLEESQISLKLQISSAISTYLDQSIVQFNGFATEDFDPEFDAYDILAGLEEAPGLYFVSKDDAKLSINTYPELNENIVIPLYCTVGIDGYYTIEALSILNFLETTEVMLEDKVENVIIDFKEQSSYTFIAGVDNEPDRFNLKFLLTPDNTIEIADNRDVQIYASNDAIYLKRQDANTLDGEIRIFDLMGRLIVSERVDGTQKYEMTLEYEGILIVTFFDNSDQKEYRQKVHIK